MYCSGARLKETHRRMAYGRNAGGGPATSGLGGGWCNGQCSLWAFRLRHGSGGHTANRPDERLSRSMTGDSCVGRSSRQRQHSKSELCNDFKVSVYGRDEAVRNFAETVDTDRHLRSSLWKLCYTLLTRCKCSQWCHADELRPVSAPGNI